MKPAAFEYVAARSVDEALEALASSDGARVLAGGQSLVPLMNLRLARPDLLVDVNGIVELDAVEVDDGMVRLGALVRHRRLELDGEVSRRLPLLAEAASHVGHPQIRNRATLGGTLAHGDPVAELTAALVALDATVTLRSGSGTRSLPVRELHDGYLSTAIAPGELLVDVAVPSDEARHGSAFREHAPRHGDFALAGIAAHVTFGDDGLCTAARLAGCALGTTIVDLDVAVAHLVGERQAGDDALVAVATAVGHAVHPQADVHGTAEYRRDLAQALAVDAVRVAWRRGAEAAS